MQEADSITKDVNFRYWFTDKEIQQLRGHVQQFEVPRPEYELILTYYRKPVGLERGVYTTSSQIIGRFGNTSLRLSLQKVGRAMRELDFRPVKVSNANYWVVVERTTEEVQLGKYALLSRPSDSGHTPFGDIYISFSPDMKFWGEHRHVMAPTPFPESAWQCTKIGAGSVPFLTDEGWLMFYHGVITTCNGFRYSMGAAILDKDNPAKLLYRTREYLLAPAAPYELQGDVPNVVFPCAALQDGERVAVYYGAADTVVGLAFGYIREILEFTKRTSIL